MIALDSDGDITSFDDASRLKDLKKVNDGFVEDTRGLLTTPADIDAAWQAAKAFAAEPEFEDNYFSLEWLFQGERP